MSRTPLLPALLATAVLLGGCGGDDSSADRPAPTSTSASDGASEATATLVQSGLDQLDAGDTAGATSTFRNVLTLDPDNVYAHYNLGLIAQQAGDEKTAIEEYDAALAAQDDYAPALFNRGILAETRDLDQAVDLYERAVAADDQFARAYMRLGFAQVHLGDTEAGEQALARGVALDPAMADVDAPTYD